HHLLHLADGAHADIRSKGLRFIEVEHEGCSQKSEEEGAVIVKLFEDLLRHEYSLKRDVKQAMTIKDILVVAPYNVQVNYLKSILPEDARVGTVDKFQGQ